MPDLVSNASVKIGGVMLRLGGVASNTYLVGFPAIKEHFQRQGIDLDWVLYSNWDALVDAFVRREVDLAWNGPLAYVKSLGPLPYVIPTYPSCSIMTS